MFIVLLHACVQERETNCAYSGEFFGGCCSFWKKLEEVWKLFSQNYTLKHDSIWISWTNPNSSETLLRSPEETLSLFGNTRLVTVTCSVKRDYRCLHLYLKMVTSNKAPFKEEQFNWSLIFLALYVTRYHAFMNFPHFEKLASSFLGKKLKKLRER